MNNILTGRGSWLTAPVIWFLGVAALLVIWAIMEPVTLRNFFDNDGRSPFELFTLPFYAAIVPLVWMCCPFGGSKRRRTILCFAVSIVAIMAVVKELDIHNDVMHFLFPDYVNADGKVINVMRDNGKPLTGTPFKMRFLTSASVPVAAKVVALVYFSSFFGVFGITFAYFFPAFVKGVFSLNPVAWSFGCMGASGVMVQLTDRLPSWYRSVTGTRLAEGAIDKSVSLCTALEEGCELLLAVFALLAIYQSYLILKSSGEASAK